MFALTTILSMAEADPPESRNTDIELTAPQFAAAHWAAEFLGSRTQRAGGVFDDQRLQRFPVGHAGVSFAA